MLIRRHPIDIIQLIPKRIKESHKGTYGRLLIIAGSSRYTGAAALMVEAALRSGVGIVYAIATHSSAQVIRQRTPEAVVIEALREFAQKPVSSGLLRRALNQLETRTYRNLQTAHQRAVALGFWELTAGDFKGAFRLAEQYRQVTPEDVMSVCSQLLDPQYRQVVIGRQA